MHEITIKPQWTIRNGLDQATLKSLAPRVIEVLVKVHEHGSLSGACQHLNLSYRRVWDLIHQGEEMFGQPLMLMQRGRGSTLTALGEKLVWADRRIAARLSPVLDSLASELNAEIEKVMSSHPSLLRIHASHGFAVQAMHNFLGAAQVPNELRYCGSQEAVASLFAGNCDIAGFHVPLGEFEATCVAHYRQWFASAPHTQRIINVATRRQGMMVAAQNPKKIYALKDLVRPGIRFINRQPGSGTRFLLDLMLQKEGVDAAKIKGYEQCELTHAAVAAFVASGMADAGYGVETPARQFKLDFVQSQTERYFLLCSEETLATPGAQRMLAILKSEAFKKAVDALPGYDGSDAGNVLQLTEAFTTLQQYPRGKKSHK
jgi:molybdate transport repressor ModE-like protein